MKTYQFKTNINCQNCVAQVKPVLDKLDGLKEWNVETTDKDKTLTVKAENLKPEEIEAAVKSAGFTADSKKDGILNTLFGKK